MNKCDIKKVNGVYIKIHGMPCVNRCKHCYYYGAPGKPMMEHEKMDFILEKTAEIKEKFPLVMPQYFDEPTIHPDFVRIFEKQSKLGLIWNGFFFPTNGYGLARMNGTEWKRLKEAGFDELQFTFYGLEEVHDKFAGRKGAFKDLVTAIRKANQYDLNWYATVIFHTGLIGKLPQIIEEIKKIGENRGKKVGWFIFHWQGRGIDDKLRPRKKDYDNLPDGLQRKHWKPEYQHIDEILKDKALRNKTALEALGHLCNYISLEVQYDMSIYYGGGCDYAPSPEFLPYLKIGKLGKEGFFPLIKKYLEDPPLALKLLEKITWGELAERFGDKSNDCLHFQSDVVGNKWTTMHLKDKLKIPSTII